MKKYGVEIYFRESDSPSLGLDQFPQLDSYSNHTKTLEFSTWDNYKNEVLRLHPEAAFILVHYSQEVDVGHTDREVDVHQYETDQLCIGDSQIHEKGVFASVSIRKGAELYELTGDLVNLSDIEGAYPEGEWNALSDEIFLCRKNRTLYSFINHSRTPNAYIDFGTLKVTALSDIEMDEEILVDYRKEALPAAYILHFGKHYL